MRSGFLARWARLSKRMARWAGTKEKAGNTNTSHEVDSGRVLSHFDERGLVSLHRKPRKLWEFTMSGTSGFCRSIVSRLIETAYIARIDKQLLRKRLDPFCQSSYCSSCWDRVLQSTWTRRKKRANRPRKQLESSAPLGFVASGIFFALREMQFPAPDYRNTEKQIRRRS